MQSKWYPRVIIFSILIWSLFTGCYAYLDERKTDKPVNSGPIKNYFECLIRKAQKSVDEKFKYEIAPYGEIKVVKVEGFDDNKKDDALKAPLILRFAWFSDVQFRQREVVLYNNFLSRQLDRVISGAERNAAQEEFLWAVYLSQIEAVNQLHRKDPNEPIDFMIHTGDSIDIGSIQELYQFIYISDRLEVPWLNLVGNHDLSIFGNYEERLGYGRDRDVNIYPVGDLADFIWMHREKREISGIGRYLLPVPATSPHEPSVNPGQNKKLPPTSHHGFDLKSGNKNCFDKLSPASNYDERGYYATDLCDPEKKCGFPVRLIALNSTRKSKIKWGPDYKIKDDTGYPPVVPADNGFIDDDQLEWLRCQLRKDDKAIKLVFVHHRPEELNVEVQDLLTDSRNGALVVFTGHTHKHHLKLHEGSTGGGYYELNTGSVLEFPQIGRLIELRGEPKGPVYLISRALWNSYMTVTEMEMKSLKSDIGEAQKEECNNIENSRNDLKRAVLCGNYGAYLDYDKNTKKWWRFWDRTQTIDEAKNAANVIIQVSP